MTCFPSGPKTKRILLGIAALALAAGAGRAGDPVLFGGERWQPRVPMAHFASPHPPPPGTVAIIDNINRLAGPVTYNCCQAYGVEGPQNWLNGMGGIESKIAVAFTPALNLAVTEIDVPISYYAGTNSTVVGIYTDDHDKPGRMMRSWTFQNLPPFNTCCGILAATWPSGIAVVAGRQYWIVVQAAAPDTISMWNITSVEPTTVRHIKRWCDDNQLPGGFHCLAPWMSHQWNPEDGDHAPALAILGKT